FSSGCFIQMGRCEGEGGFTSVACEHNAVVANVHGNNSGHACFVAAFYFSWFDSTGSIGNVDSAGAKPLAKLAQAPACASTAYHRGWVLRILLGKFLSHNTGKRQYSGRTRNLDGASCKGCSASTY